MEVLSLLREVTNKCSSTYKTKAFYTLTLTGSHSLGCTWWGVESQGCITRCLPVDVKAPQLPVELKHHAIEGALLHVPGAQRGHALTDGGQASSVHELHAAAQGSQEAHGGSWVDIHTVNQHSSHAVNHSVPHDSEQIADVVDGYGAILRHDINGLLEVGGDDLLLLQ